MFFKLENKFLFLKIVYETALKACKVIYEEEVTWKIISNLVQLINILN